MRILSSAGFLSVALATLALACAERRGPIGPASRPEPQAAASEPTPQPPQDPVAAQRRPQEPVSQPTPQQPLSEPRPQQPVDVQKPFYGPGTTPGDERQAKTEKPLTDAEILGVAHAVNRGEVQMADVALKKATSPDVKQFAKTMKTDHQRALDEGKKLEQKAKLTPGDSDLSTTLKTDTEKTLGDLKDKKGREFDRAYMDAQLKAHKDVLTAIDTRLLPSVQHAELKTMVTTLRTHVADHLTKAEEIQQKLQSGAVSGSERKSEPKAKKPLEKR